MKTVNYTNFTYDDNLKAGDLITTYYKGYYTFVHFEDRGKNTTPLVHFHKAFNSNGKPCKSKKILTCDASYCKLAVEPIQAEIQKKKEEIITLQKILETIPSYK